MTTLEGKVALITASVRGIAERYALLGATVAVNCAKDQESASETVAAVQSGGSSATNGGVLSCQKV